jgi:hypothetical protein
MFTLRPLDRFWKTLHLVTIVAALCAGLTPVPVAADCPPAAIESCEESVKSATLC